MLLSTKFVSSKNSFSSQNSDKKNSLKDAQQYIRTSLRKLKGSKKAESSDSEQNKSYENEDTGDDGGGLTKSFIDEKEDSFDHTALSGEIFLLLVMKLENNTT